MKKLKIRSSLAVLAVLGLFAGAAEATPISYYGAIFDLSIAAVGDGTYNVTYTADFTNFTNSGTQSYVSAIAWKEPSETLLSVNSVTVTPSNTGWTATETNGLSSSGAACSTDTTKNWACASDSTLNYISTNPSTGLVTWVFNVTFYGTPDLSTEGDSVKMLFTNSDYENRGLMSCTLVTNPEEDNCSGTSTSVPEPASLGLLGLGLLGVGAAARRARANAKQV